MKHVWSILCRRSVIDNETNNISLYDALEELSVGVKVKQQVAPMPEVINIPIDYEVVSLWMKEDKKTHAQADTEIEVVQPNGKPAKSFLQKIDMPEKMQRLRARYRINGFGVTMPGTYWFKIKIREIGEKQFKTVSEIPLE
ncbi:MAG: hypothetical protein AAB907_01770, partial [Patescibacteria group bacterium]